MNLDIPNPDEPGFTIFESTNSLLVEFTDEDGLNIPAVWTPASLLAFMRKHVEYYGAPLPEGFVAPPGIDLAALLKQVPWPPEESDDSAKG